MYNDLIEKIKQGFFVRDADSFNECVKFFLDESAAQERLAFYKDKMNSVGLENEAEAKYRILRQVFSGYVQYSLNEANIAVNEDNRELAKEYVDRLEKLMNVFKNHDVSDYNKFIVDSENRITDVEVELLFKKPVLNKKELDKLNNAFINAFGKKKDKIADKEDFQREFFNHPLIQCLDAYSDIRTLEKNIEQGKLELGEYKNLVEAMLKLRGKINAEKYQGFITFVIHEDLAYGLNNIIKNDHYKPQFLRNLLSDMTKGKVLDNSNLESLIYEITENHTRNVALNNWSVLSEKSSSVAALNDYGFDVKVLPELKMFIHGHATENSGGNQNDQQVNTAAILREKIGVSTIGITVMLHEVTRTESHRAFLSDFGHLMNFSKSDEMILSGLQFDASFFSNISLREDLTLDELKKSDFLSSNHYIVKEDIKRSQDIINNNIGKNDFELLCEKKNAYMRIVEQNKDLFKNALQGVSTDNQLMFQLISEPLLNFFKSTLEIEKQTKVKLFTGKEIELIGEIVSVHMVNTKIKSLRKDCLDKLEIRSFLGGNYVDVNSEKYNALSNLGKKDHEKINRTEKKNFIGKDHVKYLDGEKFGLDVALEYCANNPINASYKESYKKKVIAALSNKLIAYAENNLNYREDKNNQLLYGLKLTIGNLTGAYESAIIGVDKDNINLDNGRNVDVKLTVTPLSTEYETVTKARQKQINNTLATLIKDARKSDDERNSNTVILNALLSLADMCDKNITVKNINLKEEIKVKVKP